MAAKDKISKWFTEEEATCHCKNCEYVPVDSFLLVILDDVRDHFGKPVVPSCMVRCPYWNKHEGSTALQSRHLPHHADACDFSIKGIHPSMIFAYIHNQYGDVVGLHYYSWGCHLDTRGYKARW